MKRILLSLLWLCSACGETQNAQPQIESDEILIGAATSGSGWMAAFDTGPTRAAELAVDRINADGGLLGKQIRLAHIDTKTDPAQAARAAQELVAQDVKLLMTACDFDQGAPAALVAQQANILAMSSCGADRKFGDLVVGNNVFTMATDAAATGRIMADWAAREQGWTRAYVLVDTFIEYNKSLCQGFVDRWTELNGKGSVILEDSFKNADVSVSSQISRYNALDIPPDTMMLCSVPPGLASAIRQFRAAGIETPILAGTGGDGSAWHSGVPGLSNYYYLNYAADAGVEEPRSEAEQFLQAFEAKWGQRPGSGQAITGYSVVEGWARAVERAGTFDTDKVRAELEKFDAEPLAAGLTSFTDERHININRPMLIVEIQDGSAGSLGYWDIRNGTYLPLE